MGSTIRNLGIRIGVDLSQYNTAIDRLKTKQQAIESTFRTAANQMENWQTSTQGLSLRMQSLNEKISVQRQVVQSLSKAHADVVNAGHAESDAAQRLDSQYIAASKTLDKMNRELLKYKEKLNDAAVAEGKTGAEAQTMGAQVGNANNKFANAKAQLSDIASSTVGQFMSVTGAVTAAYQALKSYFAMIEKAADYGDGIKTQAEQIGVTTEKLQELKYAAIDLDIEVDTLMRSMGKTVKAIGEAEKAGRNYIEVSDGVRVSTVDASGAMRDSEDVFYSVIDAIGGLSNETKKETATQNLFGKSYQDIIPLINAGTDALKKYTDAAANSGAVLDDVTIAALDALNDNMEKIDMQIEASSARAAANLGETYQATHTLQKQLEASWNRSGWIMFLSPFGAMANETSNAIAGASGSLDDFDTKIAEVAYVTGESTAKIERKYQRLFEFLKKEGMASADAQAQALSLIANGYDLMSYRAEQAADAQALLNDAATSALDEYTAALKTYEDAVKASAANIESDMGGMFGTITEQAKVTGEELLNNQQTALQIASEFEKNVALLKQRGLSSDMIAQIQANGVSDYQNVAALANMTDKQLMQWQIGEAAKQRLANGMAQMQNIDLGTNVMKTAQAASKAGMTAAAGYEVRIPDNFITSLGAKITAALGNITTQLKLTNQSTLNIDGEELATQTAQIIKKYNLLGQTGG